MRFPHPVTIIRAAASTDRYGDTTEDWAAALRTPGYAWVQRRSTSEENSNRSAVLSEWVAFMPPTSDVLPDDRLEWGARAFRVVGDTTPLDHPSGPHHLEVPLDLVEG